MVLLDPDSEHFGGKPGGDTQRHQQAVGHSSVIVTGFGDCVGVADILSRARLPIPPLGRGVGRYNHRGVVCQLCD